jgi:citrate lyase subunit beta / citryl-CoA lyase
VTFWGQAILEVPSNVERLLEKAFAGSADGLMLDLEDSVPPDGEQKALARENIRRQVTAHAGSGKPIGVRTNLVGSEWFYEDLRKLKGLAIDFVVLPMVTTPDEVRRSAEAIVELTGAPREMVLCVETPAALAALGALVAASDRVTGLLGGGFDYTLAVAPLQLIHRRALSEAPAPELDPLNFSRQMLLMTARAAGIHVYDGLQVLDHKDPVEVARAARLIRVVGFDGAMCFSPSLLPAIHAAFAPTAEEVTWAQTITAALHAAHEQGRSAAYTEYGTALPHHFEVASDILKRVREADASEREDDLPAQVAGEH